MKYIKYNGDMYHKCESIPVSDIEDAYDASSILSDYVDQMFKGFYVGCECYHKDPNEDDIMKGVCIAISNKGIPIIAYDDLDNEIFYATEYDKLPI